MKPTACSILLSLLCLAGVAHASENEPWPAKTILSPEIIENVFIALEGAAKGELEIQWRGTLGPDKGQGQVFGVLGVEPSGSVELWVPILSNCSFSLERVTWNEKKVGKGWRKESAPYQFQVKESDQGGMLKFRFGRKFPGDSRRPFEFHCDVTPSDSEAETQYFALFERRAERNGNALNDFGRCGQIQVVPQ